MEEEASRVMAETPEHEHIFGQWSPWSKVAFDRWHRQRECECGMVEDDSTNNPRIAGAAPPTGTTFVGDDEEEEVYNAAMEIPTPVRDSRPVRLPEPINILDGDTLNTAYQKAIETVAFLKKAIDEREARRAKAADVLADLL